MPLVNPGPGELGINDNICSQVFFALVYQPCQIRFWSQLGTNWTENAFKKSAWEGSKSRVKPTSSEKLPNFDFAIIYITFNLSSTLETSILEPGMN